MSILKLSASKQLQLVAEPPASMAQVGALVREAVLEELLAGEVRGLHWAVSAIATRSTTMLNIRCW